MIEPPEDLFSNYYYKKNSLFSTYQWKKLSFYSGFILFTLIIFINCNAFQKKVPEETVEFSEPLDSKGFFKPSDKRALTLLEFVKELEEKSSSFTADFSLKIVTGSETNNINGKIFYEKDGKKVKIQLLDPFFGAILSQILANPSEKKVKVVRNTDEYLYMFYDSGLESLEYISKDKNLQAKAKVSESSKKGTHPPEKILTRVSEITTGKNISQVDIVYKNIKRAMKIPDKEFQL